MDLRNLPIIDWEQGKKLAGNKKEVAQELLNLLVKNLREDVIRIKRLYAEQNYTELLRQVHKLHGALCYCGVPRLKTIVECLETDLKNHIMDRLMSLLDQFDTEAQLLLAQYSCP